MSVYGGFLTAFPELMRTIEVFTKEDKSDLRRIRGVYMPTRGDSLKSQKFTNRGKAVQYFEDDCLFVSWTYKDVVDVGDYFYEPNSGYLNRIVGRADWSFEGGFMRFITERVTGASVDNTETLEVKEAQFA